MSDNTAAVYLEGGDFGDILRAGSGADTLKGGGGNDVLEGGAGADKIEGGAGADKIEGGLGIDTASYEHAGGGVYVRLDSMFGYGGEAQDDELFDIENLAGSAFADSLIGDDNNNTLRGNGGLDDIAGRDGDDRIVVSSTPGSVGGDGGEDVLIVMGGGTVSLGWMNFDGIEAVYVRNDTHLHMTDVQVGSRIASQSTSGHAVEIVGTSGNDTIKSGKGGDAIDGGTGSDRLFAGTGADSFRFEAGFGRDNLYGLDLNADHILIDVAGVGDIVLRSLNNGRHTLVTFEGVEAGNKIILHDMNVDDVRDAQNELFLFGA